MVTLEITTTPPKAPSMSGGSSSHRESSPSAQEFTPEQWLRNVRSKKSSELETLRGEAQVEIITDTMMHLQNHPGDGELLSAYLRRLKRGHNLETKKTKNLTDVIVNLKTFRDIPEDVVTQWVLTNSDLDSSDMLKIRSADSESPWMLASHGTGLSMHTKLIEDLSQVALLIRFLNKCKEKSGSRIATIKSDGIVMADGSLNWKDVVLAMTFDDKEMLSEVTHVPTGTKAQIPPGFPISKAYQYYGFWCAQDAVAVMQPLKPVRLQTLFGSSSMPFGHVSGGSYKKAKDELIKQVMMVKAQWEDDLKKAKGDQCEAEEQRQAIAQQIKEAKTAERRSKVPAMQEKAKALLEQKMVKRKLKL